MLLRDERGEIATSYLFLIAMSLLLIVAVWGLSVPIRLYNEMTVTSLGENTP
ncbi:MAG: hypothetical protein ABW352_14565 [Polyangiales bacterium]